MPGIHINQAKQGTAAIAPPLNSPQERALLPPRLVAGEAKQGEHERISPAPTEPGTDFL